MAFFIQIKGNITELNFPYLDSSDKPRLADTRIHGEERKIHVYEIDQLKSDVFAIEVMSKGIEMLSPANHVSRALELMKEKNIHHLPLQVDNRIVGIISYNDILQFDRNKTLKDARIVDYMERTVLCVSESTPLRHIVSVFMHEYIHCLPVVDDDLMITGIITENDIFRWMLDKNKCVS